MAMVEFVIILPVLLLLVFSIVELSVTFGRWLTIGNAVREGVRTAIVYRPTCQAAQVEAEARQTVKDYAASAGMTLNDGAIEVNGDPCGPRGTTIEVRATYIHQFQALANLVGSELAPTVSLVGSAVMRNEGSAG
jgi:Flp pilus assembly protein TadG